MAGTPSSILNAPVPPGGTPMVDKNLNVTNQWLFFFVSLAKRTDGAIGTTGSGGGISSADLQSALENISIFDAAGDAPDVSGSGVNPFLAAAIMSDAS